MNFYFLNETEIVIATDTDDVISPRVNQHYTNSVRNKNKIALGFSQNVIAHHGFVCPI